MFNKFLTLITCLMMGAVCSNLSAQSLQDLQKELDETKVQLTDLEKKRIDLEKRINDFDVIGWKMGGTGGLGFNLAGFSDSWVVGKGENLASLLGNLGLYANYNQDTWFWNNTGLLRLGYQRSATKVEDLFDDWARNQDEIFLSSLYGYKLTEQFAISALADARTSFGNFFDPGYVSVGIGGTWKPNNNLVVVIHPLTYRGTFAKTNAIKQGLEFDSLDDNFKGDFGAKLAATYNRELLPRLNWASNLNIFLAYADTDKPEITWNNDFGYALTENISLAFGHTFRSYKLETFGYFRDVVANAGTVVDGVSQPTYILNADDLQVPITNDIKNEVAGLTNDQLEDYDLFNTDAFGFGQNKWLFTIGITTTFNVNKIPVLGDALDVIKK